MSQSESDVCLSAQQHQLLPIKKKKKTSGNVLKPHECQVAGDRCRRYRKRNLHFKIKAWFHLNGAFNQRGIQKLLAENT